MTYSDNGNRDTLHYRIISKSKDAPGLWGHEYCRHLAAEIGEEYGLIIAEMGGEEGAAAPSASAPAGTATSGATTTDPAAAVNGETLVASDNSSTKAVHTTSPTDPSATVTPAQKQPRPLKTKDQLLALALELVPFFLSHNAEADAVDLLLELESIEQIEQFLDASNGAGSVEEGTTAKRDQEDRYRRVCVYMIR